VLRCSGDEDLNTQGARRTALARALKARADLVVDFTELTFLDSSGVAMLFRLVRRLGDHRQQLHVVAPSGEAVGRVLEIVEFDRAAPVHPTLDVALEAAN